MELPLIQNRYSPGTAFVEMSHHSVIFGFDILSGQKVVIRRENFIDHKSKTLACERFDLLSKLSHPNLMKVIDFFFDSSCYYLISSYAGATNLHTYLNRFGDFSEEAEVAHLFQQLAHGVKHLHGHNIVHGDIKPENIVLSMTRNGLVPILCDFGASFLWEKGMRFHPSTYSPGYSAPEIKQRRELKNGGALDIWSLGVVLHVMMCAALPPFGQDLKNFSYRPPSIFSKSLCELLRKMIHIKPNKRINIDQVLNSEWLLVTGPKSPENPQINLKKLIGARRTWSTGSSSNASLNGSKITTGSAFGSIMKHFSEG